MNKNIAIIKLSVGIGKNILEAEKAIMIAKKKKERHYNIEIYSGKPLKYIEKTPKTVNAFLRLEKRLSNCKTALKDLEILKTDPQTGLLKRMGYFIEKKKLIDSKKYTNRFILLFDADSMHELNDKYGYFVVDKSLEAIGKALHGNIRQRDKKDLVKIRNPLDNRKNDAAGDEFIIDISCKKKDVINITKRYLDKCEEYQKKLKMRN